tara:strand:- start:523 stop:801 length:279 start_codon:yes stop_codon:yes gene_type:complete
MDKFFRKNRKRLFDSKWDIIIEGLMVNNKPAFFAALYQAMMEHPTYVILSDMPVERKIQILSNMLKYYEEKEDYEKCAQLVKMQQQVNSDIC